MSVHRKGETAPVGWRAGLPPGRNRHARQKTSLSPNCGRRGGPASGTVVLGLLPGRSPGMADVATPDRWSVPTFLIPGSPVSACDGQKPTSLGTANEDQNSFGLSLAGWDGRRDLRFVEVIGAAPRLELVGMPLRHIGSRSSTNLPDFRGRRAPVGSTAAAVQPKEARCNSGGNGLGGLGIAYQPAAGNDPADVAGHPRFACAKICRTGSAKGRGLGPAPGCPVEGRAGPISLRGGHHHAVRGPGTVQPWGTGERGVSERTGSTSGRQVDGATNLTATAALRRPIPPAALGFSPGLGTPSGPALARWSASTVRSGEHRGARMWAARRTSPRGEPGCGGAPEILPLDGLNYHLLRPPPVGRGAGTDGTDDSCGRETRRNRRGPRRSCLPSRGAG